MHVSYEMRSKNRKCALFFVQNGLILFNGNLKFTVNINLTITFKISVNMTVIYEK